VQAGRFRDNHDMAGVFARLDDREAPCHDVASAGAGQKIDPLPAAGRFRGQCGEEIEILEGEGARPVCRLLDRGEMPRRDSRQYEPDEAVAVAVTDARGLVEFILVLVLCVGERVDDGLSQFGDLFW
jgi:hypothetical protein